MDFSLNPGAIAAGRSAGQPEADPAIQKPFQLVKYFTITSLVIILLCTLAISSVISQRTSELVLHKREQYVQLLGENLNHQVMVRFVEPVLREFGGINTGHPTQFALLDAVVKNTIHSFQVLQVNILDLNGNMIYSTQPEYIGRINFEEDMFARSAAGEMISVLDPPRDAFDFGVNRTQVLKTFLPLRDERRLTAELGSPRAVFEIMMDISEDFREVWLNQLIIIGTLLCMMALLFVILRSIVIRGQWVMARRAALQASLEEQLNQSERLAALGRMIAGVAHEIRNPLGIVRSTAELLGRRVDEQQQGLAQVIVEESSRLNAIVTEFLDFARPQQAQLVPLKVEEVLERNLQALQAETDRLGVVVKRFYHSPPLLVRGDANLLYRAFLNVLNNALQAMDGQENGVLTVQTFTRRNSSGKRWLVVAVEDNGPGFARNMEGNFIDPFFTTKEKGTGLGLSIVNSIIENHHGRLELKPADQGGARVEISLRPVD